MKKVITASYINEDEGRSVLDNDIKSLQRIRNDIEELMDYNRSYPNAQSSKIVKELTMTRNSVISALKHLWEAADLLGD